MSTLQAISAGGLVHDLRSGGPAHDEATAQLRAVLLRAARFEVDRRRSTVPHLGGAELEELAAEAAEDALAAVLARLDEFRGASRFTTWASKFALVEAAVQLRRRAWQGDVPLDSDSRDLCSIIDVAHDDGPEARELLAALRTAVDHDLTPHERRVLVALAVHGVPIDVLADRLGTTRGALYETLHLARRALRLQLAARGLAGVGL